MINNRFWKKRAEKYDKTNWVKDKHFLDALISMIPQETSYNDILEVGIGTGVVAKYVVEKFGPLTGIDISEEMMSKIKHNDITKIIADVHDLPFNDKKFDFIYMRNVIHYLDKPKKAFDEIYRCLKPKGIFLFSQVIPYKDEISIEYDELIGRNIHYPTLSEINSLFYKYKILDKVEYVLESQSIMNWLNNTCENEQKKQHIIDKHKTTSKLYKNLVNYCENDKDIFVDIKHYFVLSEKNQNE